MGKFIDTHCHPNLNQDKDADSIIQSFFDNNGEALIVVGTDINSSLLIERFSKLNEKIFFLIGIHPNHIDDANLKNSIEKLENDIQKYGNKIVGIGECGLDYYWIKRDIEKLSIDEESKLLMLNEVKDKQKAFLKSQIDLAKKYDLTIVIHNREASEDIYEIIKETGLKKFVFHCFSENLDYANKLLELSSEAMISFSGIITFKNAKDIQETAKNIPLKNILAETDSPYLTPMPFRGKEENEPSFTRYCIEKIAELRNEDLEYVESKILENSKKTFKI